jgi:hypothetical protein
MLPKFCAVGDRDEDVEGKEGGGRGEVDGEETAHVLQSGGRRRRRWEGKILESL